MRQDKNINLNNNQKIILDLEKKYFTDLVNLFSGQDFFDSLKDLKNWISRNYSKLQSWKKNKQV